MPRIRPPSDPVTIRLDGHPVVAARGEPAAVALIAAGRLALSRSPKFHRPRGPACLRAACDGCLARVDDVPNVMTCRIPAVDGMRIETQNVVGSRSTDVLRVADWFFPDGMNHHELFAGVPGVERILQGFARRVAGLGRLPANGASGARAAARRREVDVLVVGSGPSGMAAAIELSGRGRRVEVVDDDLFPGGSARILPEPAALAWIELVRAFDAAVASGRVTVRVRTTAAGLYGDDLLVVSDANDADADADATACPPVEVLSARTLVLATGAHDGVLAFEGNDVPAVMSTRAACRLLGHGALPGTKIVVAAVAGGGPFGAAYVAARAQGGASDTVWVPGPPLRVRGSGRVKAVTIAGVEIACDALLVDAPRAPAYELCAQAGAALTREPRGFRVVPGAGGRLREGVVAVGEVAGTPLEPVAIRDEARAMADAL